MKVRNWNEIKLKLQYKICEIFSDVDLRDMTEYEIRKTIFNYLYNNLEYDYDLLKEKQKFNSLVKAMKNDRNIRRSSDYYTELDSVINHGKGICNGLSQYYKLLLEQLGIISYCVICDIGKDVAHELLLVYDRKNDTYSFDDIAGAIIMKDVNSFFDYDIETANTFNQGNKEVDAGYKWLPLSEDYINILVGRKDSPCPKINKLPFNISSVKQDNVMYK